MIRLKNIREQNNLSQLELADKLGLGVSQQTISKYENGINEPDLSTLKKIAIFFNVSTDYLLDLTDLPNITSTLTIKEKEWLQLYYNIPLNKRDELIGYIKGYTDASIAKNEVLPKKIVG